MPDTSVSATLTFISPASDAPPVILSVIASPVYPSGPWPTARAVTSTVRAVASPSSMAWVSRGGPGPSCFGLEASPPQATASSAAPASASVPTMAVVLPIAFLLLRPAPSVQPGISTNDSARSGGRCVRGAALPAKTGRSGSARVDKNRRRQTPERACRGGYPPDLVTGRVTERGGRGTRVGDE